jgi:hypothetical protein
MDSAQTIASVETISRKTIVLLLMLALLLARVGFSQAGLEKTGTEIELDQIGPS